MKTALFLLLTALAIAAQPVSAKPSAPRPRPTPTRIAPDAGDSCFRIIRHSDAVHCGYKRH